MHNKRLNRSVFSGMTIYIYKTYNCISLFLLRVFICSVVACFRLLYSGKNWAWHFQSWLKQVDFKHAQWQSAFQRPHTVQIQNQNIQIQSFICVIITVSLELTLLDGLLLVKRVPARVGSVSAAWERNNLIAIANVLSESDVVIKSLFNLKDYNAINASTWLPCGPVYIKAKYVRQYL